MAAKGSREESRPSENLYVWQLPQDADEVFLEDLFKQVAPVVSVKVIPHKRYGFVRFGSTEEAASALDALNGLECHGTVLKVKFAEAPGGGKGQGKPAAEPQVVAPPIRPIRPVPSKRAIQPTHPPPRSVAPPAARSQGQLTPQVVTPPPRSPAAAGVKRKLVPGPRAAQAQGAAHAPPPKRPSLVKFPPGSPGALAAGPNTVAPPPGSPGALAAGPGMVAYPPGSPGALAAAPSMVAYPPGSPGALGTVATHTESAPEPSSNLYVWQLPKDCDDQFLLDLFGQVGTIVSVKCFTDRCYGFVRMATVEEADQAIEEVNNLQTDGTTIRVKYADNKKGGGNGYDQSGPAPSDADQGWHADAGGLAGAAHVVPPPTTLQSSGARIFIEDLPPDISPEDILYIFDNYCAADDCQVLWSDSSQSIAMIYVPTESEAEWILENLNGNILEGLDSPIRVSMAQQPMETPRKIAPLYGKADAPESASHRHSPYDSADATSEPGGEHANVYVYQLPDGSDDVYLRELFEECGTIVSVKCVADRRYGFVKFSNSDEAKHAIDTMNGLVIEGTEKAILCRFAKR